MWFVFTHERMFTRSRVCAAGAVAVIAGAAAADTWTEIGDAGQLPGSEQIIGGTGALTQIIGNISSNVDVDLFRIYISDPAAFSASSTGGASFNTNMALFDASGMGVIGDDDAYGTDQSALSSGSIFSPTSPGEYLLAITNYANSASSVDGDIFSFDAGAMGDDGNLVAGPDGIGGNLAIDLWNNDDIYLRTDATGGYIINLTGAESIGSGGGTVIPLPSAAGMGLVGLLIVASRRRR